MVTDNLSPPLLRNAPCGSTPSLFIHVDRSSQIKSIFAPFFPPPIFTPPRVSIKRNVPLFASVPLFAPRVNKAALCPPFRLDSFSRACTASPFRVLGFALEKSVQIPPNEARRLSSQARRYEPSIFNTYHARNWMLTISVYVFFLHIGKSPCFEAPGRVPSGIGRTADE